ncbi:MAG: hypothetical protein KKG47_15150 [Proteobacteria bacterium]|nr:hypothetical protein [Pseudomonadota bacterium]MBU1737996.1 hypothetical protein [Pseudomonadota bacterium]
MKFIHIFAMLLFLFPTYGLCANNTDRPAPPPELTEIATHFSDLEESFEAKNWNEALEHLNKANSLIGVILPNLRQNTDRKDLNTFRMKFMNLKESIEGRHYELAEEGYIDAQKAYFILTDYYAFKTPFFLGITGKYLDEAVEAAEKNDYKNVAAEMVEVSEFIESFDKQLESHGVKGEDLETFILTCYRTRKAAENGEQKKIEEGLDTLKDLHAVFIKLF